MVTKKYQRTTGIIQKRRRKIREQYKNVFQLHILKKQLKYFELMHIIK